MFALSLYRVSHKFTLSQTAHKGKNKGKYIRVEHCIQKEEQRWWEQLKLREKENSSKAGYDPIICKQGRALQRIWRYSSQVNGRYRAAQGFILKTWISEKRP